MVGRKDCIMHIGTDRITVTCRRTAQTFGKLFSRTYSNSERKYAPHLIMKNNEK